MDFIFAGAFGVLGYLLLAVGIGWLDAWGVRAFTNRHLTGLVFLTALVTFVAIYYRGSKLFWCRRPKLTVQPASAGDRLLRGAVCLIGAALMLSVLVSVAYSPVSGWDTLGLWTTWAKNFAVFDSTSWVVNGASRDFGDSYPSVHGRHPMTLIYVAAFSAFVSEGLSSVKGWLLPWTYIWLCGLGCVVGMVKLSSRGWTSTVIAAYLYLSMPLLENHAILVGYADPWVATCVVASAAVLAAGIFHSCHILMMVGILFAATPLLLKNTGVLYSVALAAPLAYHFLRERWRKMYTFFIFLLAALLALFMWQGGTIEFMGTRYGIDHGENSIIFFGGWAFEFQIYPLWEVAINQFFAFFVNQSFSVAFAGLCLIGALFFGGGFPGPPHSDLLAARYIVLVAVALLLFFSLPQLVTHYSHHYAVPSSDVGNSRFLLAVGSLLVLTTGFILNPKSRDTAYRDHEMKRV